jgi:hypothetical protein
MVLLGHRPQALGQRPPLAHAQAELAAAAAEHVAVHRHDIAQVAVRDGREPLLAERVQRRVQLQLAGAVGQVEEDRLAVAAAAADPARDWPDSAPASRAPNWARTASTSARSGVRAG